MEIHNAHAPPGSSRGLLKVHAFEAISRRLDARPRVRKLLCADLNAPLAEDDAGPLPSGYARRDVAPHPGEWTRAQAQRWAMAEASLLEHPRMRDAWRETRKSGEPFPVSHFTRGGPKRYDYIFISPQLRATACTYLTDWVEETAERKRLSDHAPVEVDFTVVR